ncbi:MAG: hypothetical protein H0Z40_01375 [Desulfotomaculum sp.]|nr:hypothetical protein [Desulfotomaculum sp.]
MNSHVGTGELYHDKLNSEIRAFLNKMINKYGEEAVKRAVKLWVVNNTRAVAWLKDQLRAGVA